jgi:hypothetical protein
MGFQKIIETFLAEGSSPHECDGAIYRSLLHHAEARPVVDARSGHVPVEGVGLHCVHAVEGPLWRLPHLGRLLGSISLESIGLDLALGNQIRPVQHLQKYRQRISSCMSYL